MAVDIKVLTGSGRWAGASADIASYSASEEATPDYAHDSSGAVAQVQFSVLEDADSRYMIGNTLELTDGSNGTTRFDVHDVSANNGILSVTGHAVVGRLVGYARIGAYTGTLGGYLTGVFQTVGITPFVEGTISAVPLDIRAYEGDRWEYLKQLAAVYGFDIAYVSNQTVIRPKFERVAHEVNKVDSGWSVTKNQSAAFVSVTYTLDTYVEQVQLFPPNGEWTPDTETIQVGVNEEIEQIIDVEASIISLKQPVAQQFVAKDYAGTNSVYTIAGNDGLPISPSMWRAYGGSVSLEIADDTRGIVVKAKGASLEHLGPFTLSVNSGVSDPYSSLRVVGEAVVSVPHTVTVYTGADPLSLSDEEGQTLDSPAIRTADQAYTAAFGLAAESSGYTVQVTGTTQVLNRPGDKGIATYLSMGFYNEYIGGGTFGQFDTANATKTFGAFYDEISDAASAAADDGSFENQAFGNTAGAVLKRPEATYRIKSAQINESTIQYTAVPVTNIGEFNTAYDSMTFAQFNQRAAGLTFSEFNMTPLNI